MPHAPARSGSKPIGARQRLAKRLVRNNQHLLPTIDLPRLHCIQALQIEDSLPQGRRSPFQLGDEVPAIAGLPKARREGLHRRPLSTQINGLQNKSCTVQKIKRKRKTLPYTSVPTVIVPSVNFVSRPDPGCRNRGRCQNCLGRRGLSHSKRIMLGMVEAAKKSRGLRPAAQSFLSVGWISAL